MNEGVGHGGSLFKAVTIISELLQRHLNPANHADGFKSRGFFFAWLSVPFFGAL